MLQDTYVARPDGAETKVQVNLMGAAPKEFLDLAASVRDMQAKQRILLDGQKLLTDAVGRLEGCMQASALIMAATGVTGPGMNGPGSAPRSPAPSGNQPPPHENGRGGYPSAQEGFAERPVYGAHHSQTVQRQENFAPPPRSQFTQPPLTWEEERALRAGPAPVAAPPGSGFAPPDARRDEGRRDEGAGGRRGEGGSVGAQPNPFRVEVVDDPVYSERGRGGKSCEYVLDDCLQGDPGQGQHHPHSQQRPQPRQQQPRSHF